VRTFAIIVLLLLLIIIIFSIPAVQTYVAKKVTTKLNEAYGTDIHVERLGLNWKGQVDLREVYIADHHQDTLIYSRQVQTNIISFRNLINGDLGFGNIDLQQAKFYLKTYKDEESPNINVFANLFDDGSPPSGKVFSMLTNDVRISDGTVKIIDENLESPEIFNLTNVNLFADELKITGSIVEVDLKELSLDAQRGFHIKNLQTKFKYTLEEISVRDMILETMDSKLIGEVIMTAENPAAYSNFENDVSFRILLNDSKVSSNDLNSFYDEFGKDLQIGINAKMEGPLNDFTVADTDLTMGLTRIRGDFKFKDILEGIDAYKITSPNHRISTSYYDLRRIMPRVLGSVVPAQLKSLGNFGFNGNTTIDSEQLDTKSKLQSALGMVDATLLLGNMTDIDNAYYKGHLIFDQFNLGKLTETESLGLITADLNVDGRGFKQKSLNTKITGTISSFEFQEYSYKNIEVSGTLKDPLFNGKLKIDDPNLKMDFNGLVDVSKNYNQYDFEADVEFAEFNKLNLFTRDSISVFAGNIIVDMDGTTIDNAVGSISFKQTFYQNEVDNYYFDDFRVLSTFNGEVRTIEINSPDIINGSISGTFSILDIPNLFQNGIGSIYSNYIAQEVTPNQYIDYEFTVYNKVVEVFVPQLKLGENTRLKGSVFSDESKFKLDLRSPEITVFDYYANNLNVQVDNDNPLFNTYVSIDSVYTGFYNLTEVNLINKTIKDTLYVRSRFKGGADKEDLFNLSLYHTINPRGKSVIGVKRSEITYKDNVWYLNENNNQLNKVSFDDHFNEVKIDSLVLSHNNELIQMAGVIRDSTFKDIKLRFRDVNIGNIVPPIDSLRLEGNVNGNLDFIQRRDAFYPNSNVVIDGVVINDIAFGDLDLSVKGNETLTKYDIDMSLTNNQVKSITALGDIDFSPDSPQIKVNVKLNDFNAQAFSPFGGEVITDIRGLVSGNARVTGNYKSPDILGRLNLVNAGLKIPYLNTDFNLEENAKVIVTKDKFSINEIGITDTKYDTKGRFSGNATHKNFGDWRLNLDISTDNLLVLDTPADEDALYYGTAFISGTANIAGPIDELEINVDASTEEGTSFKIPLDDTESIGDDSFIHFLSPEEKQAIISGETYVTKEIKGLTLNFDLDINNNAEVEVVVDKVNNTTLKGRGAGILFLRINTLGKFEMFGDFQVYEGVFDFRYGGIINKKIDVVPGGNINWDGKPERARLDLRAQYTTEANPSILLDNPTFNRKIPVIVYVDLEGELLKPNLKFDIDFPRVSSIVKSELEFKLASEEQRQKQALFLVATGGFTNENFQGSNALTGTLVDRVSSIVNDIFTDKDGKFQVGLDYSQGSRTPNQTTADQFGVTLSTKISERILINGKIGVPVGGVNEQYVAGEFELQWLVNEDGTLRLNVFSRQADLQFIGEEQTFEQGLGMSYSVDFDTFRELITKLFNRKLTLESEEKFLPVAPDDNTFPVDFNNQAIKNEKE